MHPLNRHIFVADNLALMKSLDNESVDLICCDPPFAKNRTFVGKILPPVSEQEIGKEKEILSSWGVKNKNDAEKAGIEWPYGQRESKAIFNDIWRWDKIVHEDWMLQIKNNFESLHLVIEAACRTKGEWMGSYLVYMGIRIIEMKRILKPTGSVYIHCDITANSYLRLVLDAVFGEKNFRNEIAWCYKENEAAQNHYPKKHDTIFWYTKTDDYVFNMQRGEITEAQRKRYNKNKDGNKFREGVDEDRYAQMKGKLRKLEGGARFRSWWDDIPIAQDLERTGYPTQKPVRLADRIIKTSSNPGDLVFDPFAGCAYVPVAAERNGRQWLSCDISIRALTVMRRQFNKFHYMIDGETPEGKLETINIAQTFTKSPLCLPERTDKDPVEIPKLKPRSKRKPKVPTSDIPEDEMKKILLEFSDYKAWCCGFANRMPDGTIIKTIENFHLDHLDPKSKGGSNQIMFRAPLCPAHNQLKRDRAITLETLRDEIEKNEGLRVANRRDLIDLIDAREKAIKAYAEWKEQRPQQKTLL